MYKMKLLTPKTAKLDASKNDVWHPGLKIYYATNEITEPICEQRA